MAERLNQDVIQGSSCSPEFVLTVDRKRSISLPSPDSDREMSIRWSDLNNLKRGLTDALDIPTDFSVVYGLFFGFSGSALLACISLAFIKDLPPWVMPTSIALAVGSFIFGCGTVFFSRILRKIRRKTISNILDDVKEIERRFPEESAQQGEIIDAENYELPNRATLSPPPV